MFASMKEEFEDDDVICRMANVVARLLIEADIVCVWERHESVDKILKCGLGYKKGFMTLCY